jgi:lysophospholipase L1-like esterase
VRFIALGDSYTIGEGVSESERWPNQLAQMLRDRGVHVDDPVILARTAWTTDELDDAIAAERVREKFELVTLLVGVNDQYRSRPVTSFAAGLKPVLARAKAYAGRRSSRVIVLSIPDWGATPFAAGRDQALISREIAAYNDSARQLVEAAAMRWVDVTEATRRMQDMPALVASDGLHPSGAMYRQWAELVLPHALAALSRATPR